jgi:hypothetical protein
MAFSILERLEAATSALTVKELAAILGGTDKNIYKQAKKPAPAGIPSYLIGAKVMFDPSIVAYWFRQQQPMALPARRAAIKAAKEASCSEL